MEKNRFIKHDLAVNLAQLGMSGVLHKRSIVEVLRQHVSLSGGEILVLPPPVINLKTLILSIL